MRFRRKNEAGAGEGGGEGDFKNNTVHFVRHSANNLKLFETIVWHSNHEVSEN